MEETRKYTLSKPIAAVKGIFLDLEKFGKYHPLILKVSPLDTTEDGYQRFRIKEQPFPNLPIRIRYKAHAIEQADEINYIVSGIPLLTPQLRYVFKAIGKEQTSVEITISIKGFPIGKGFLLHKMMQAQDDLMAKI